MILLLTFSSSDSSLLCLKLQTRHQQWECVHQIDDCDGVGGVSNVVQRIEELGSIGCAGIQ